MLRVSLAAGLALLAGLAPPSAAAADDFQPEKGFVILFNGTDLTGWRYVGSREDLTGKTETADGRIKVEGGALVMMEKDKKGRGGIRDLYTFKNYDRPFHFKVQFRASLKSDSGVYVRGPQLQVRDYIRRGERPQLKKLFRNDDWNDLDIIVKHNVVVTKVNGRQLTPKDRLELRVKDGKPTARLNGKEIEPRNVSVVVTNVAECYCNGTFLETMTGIPAKGGVGLQAETGKFEFRRPRIKELE
jgi:hypothetical protein